MQRHQIQRRPGNRVNMSAMRLWQSMSMAVFILLLCTHVAAERNQNSYFLPESRCPDEHDYECNLEGEPICVNINMVCNDNKDCPNGRDEEDCGEFLLCNVFVILILYTTDIPPHGNTFFRLLPLPLTGLVPLQGLRIRTVSLHYIPLRWHLQLSAKRRRGKLHQLR